MIDVCKKLSEIAQQSKVIFSLIFIQLKSDAVFQYCYPR